MPRLEANPSADAIGLRGDSRVVHDRLQMRASNTMVVAVLNDFHAQTGLSGSESL